MDIKKKVEKELIEKLNIVLKDFKNFENASLNLEGDIVIKNKIIKKNKDSSILTDVFKEMISNDIKKNRV